MHLSDWQSRKQRLLPALSCLVLTAGLSVPLAIGGTIPKTEESASDISSQMERFCGDFPAQCVPSADAPIPLDVDLLEDINSRVNKLIRPTTDRALHEVDDYWSMPVEIDGEFYEDCDGYALKKRELLNLAGVPFSQLLIAAVGIPWQRIGPTAGAIYSEQSPEFFQYQGHAYLGHVVLVIREAGEDRVLDSLIDRIVAWENYVADGRFIVAVQDEHDARKFWAPFYQGHPGWKAYLRHARADRVSDHPARFQ